MGRVAFIRRSVGQRLTCNDGDQCGFWRAARVIEIYSTYLKVTRTSGCITARAYDSGGMISLEGSDSVIDSHSLMLNVEEDWVFRPLI
jgi:hypothetical protein